MLITQNLYQKVPVVDGELVILDGINLEIKQGETVAIVGTSGSGKTTLLGMLAGLDIPSAGEIFLHDTDITKLEEEERALMRGKYVSFVFQDFQLLGSLTALENVLLPLEVRGQQNVQVMAERYLERVGLRERYHHYPKQLSGGEQQRVALARAFACEAPLLFADEPTGNLDTVTGKKIADLLFAMNEEAGATLVLVTHDLALAQRCQRTLVMDAGQLQEQV